MEKQGIGVHYTEPIQIKIGGNQNIVCEKGLVLKTLEDSYCQRDIHYFRDTIKKIPKDTEVVVESYWRNFYGSYIRVNYKGNELDLKPDTLIYRVEKIT